MLLNRLFFPTTVNKEMNNSFLLLAIGDYGFKLWLKCISYQEKLILRKTKKKIVFTKLPPMNPENILFLKRAVIICTVRLQFKWMCSLAPAEPNAAVKCICLSVSAWHRLKTLAEMNEFLSKSTAVGHSQG